MSFCKISKIFFFILIYSLSTHAADCKKNKNIKVGIIDDGYIDYTSYLYYTLGDYSSKYSLEFEISNVNDSYEKYDIIFGEYYLLKKLKSIEFEYPVQIDEFYEINGIDIKENIFPLDLDTLILLNKTDETVSDLQSLSLYYDINKYTLGLSLEHKQNLSNLLFYNLENKLLDFNSNNLESIFHLMKRNYANINKNILNSNFDEVYKSYENNENIFTLFNDGILLYRNLDFSSFQLFPKNKYSWDPENGIFILREYSKPISFFGFSAYLNNTDGLGFLCYLLEPTIRDFSYKNFNIQLSPLSLNDLISKKNIPESYLKILEAKNKNIIDLNKELTLKDFDNIKKIIFGQKDYQYLTDANYFD